MTDSSFHTTHWSVVLAAKGDDTKARAALRELCESYREPILHSIRRAVAMDVERRYGGRNAEDLTHDFLARLLEGEMFQRLEREGGLFRAYLLGAIRHFLAKTRERESAVKRGADVTKMPLPDDSPGPDDFDDAVFDCDWARAMVDRALDSLEKTPESQSLLPWITRELDGTTRSRLAVELDMSDVAVKVALHRLRRKFRETIRKRIAETVRHESEIDGELDHLIRALRCPAS